MKKLFESWRQHLEEQELNELRSSVLNEISQLDYEKIKNWMANAPDEAYSFNNLFNGKKRVAIPLAVEPAEGPISKIILLFKDAGWDIDFKTSTVSKEEEITIPKGPRAGEKVKKVKKVRIGKALSTLLNLLKKAYSRAEGAHEEITKARAMLNKMFPKVWKDFYPPNVEELISFWNSKSEFYRKNPDAAFAKSPYVTILSRHPVDVVRMSDMNDIRSCHSRTGGYFQCAVAESRGHGPIAFLVKKKDFENYFNVDLGKTNVEDVDLDSGSEEIFEDRDRRIPGLQPVGRVRLRKFGNKEGTKFIAVPERRTYAPYGLNAPREFLEAVTKWALESQKETIGDPEKLAKDFEEGWARWGGSYEDTDDGTVLARMLEDVLDGDTVDDLLELGNLEDQRLEDEEAIQREFSETIADQLEEIQDEVNNQTKYAMVNYEFMDFEETNFYYDAYISLNLYELFGLPKDEISEKSLESWSEREDEVNEIIFDVFEDYGIWLESGNMEIWDDRWRTSWNTMEHYPTVEGFRGFAQEVIEADKKIPEALERVRERFIEEGILWKPPPLSDFVNDFSKVVKNLTLVHDEKTGKTTVTLRNPPVVGSTKDIKKAEEILKDNFESFKKAKAFTEGFIRMSIPKKSPIIDIINVDPKKQGFYMDLDGTKPKFVFDIEKFSTDGSKKIPRFRGRRSQVSDVMSFLISLNKNVVDEDLLRTVYKEFFDRTIKKAKEIEKSNNKDETIKENNVKGLFENWRRYLGSK